MRLIFGLCLAAVAASPALADYWNYKDWHVVTEPHVTEQDSYLTCRASSGGDGDPLLALEVLPPLVIRRAALFRQLDPEAQADYLRKVDASPSFALRQMMQAVKLIGCFAYLRDQTVRSRIDPQGQP